MRIVSALFIAVLFVSLSFGQDKAGNFTLKSTNGEEVSLSDFSGKIVVIDWFATWCSKCRAAMPEVKPFLNKAKKEFAEKDVVVLAICIDKKPIENIKAFAEKQGMEYTVLSDPEASTGKSYSLKTLPLIVVINKDGTIAKKFVGHKPKKTEEEIQELLVSLTSGK